MMIFVTGGTGLLGSHLLVQLAAKNNTPITAIYRNKNKLKSVEKLFRHYLKADAVKAFEKITWHHCDILDLPKLESLMEGHNEVYHCAALVSFKRRDFNRLMQVNREGTTNMVNIALHQKVKKFCFVSSTAAVGNKDIREKDLVNENGKWVLSDDTSGYSISKYSAEREVWRGAEEGLNVVIVNPSIIFGAGNWNDSSLVIFKTIQKGLKFYSPGANAFVDARDVATIMIQLMEKEVYGERFLCIGENSSFKNVFTIISEQLGVQPPKHKVNKYLMGVAWRVSVFWAAITFSSPSVTRSSALSAFKTIKYDNRKIINQLDFEFRPLKKMIADAIAGRIA